MFGFREGGCLVDRGQTLGRACRETKEAARSPYAGAGGVYIGRLGALPGDGPSEGTGVYTWLWRASALALTHPSSYITGRQVRVFTRSI